MQFFIERLKNRREILGAMLTGYLFMGFNILINIFYIPLYLKHLGKFDYGVLMMLLAFTNYIAMGIGWMTGGMQRVLGERFAENDNIGFARAYSLAKIIYAGYAIVISLLMVLVSVFGRTLFFSNTPDGHQRTVQMAILATALYFVLYYEFSVDPMALAVRKKQIEANLLQVLRLMVFAIATWFCLKNGGGVESILLSMFGGVFVARIAAWILWRREKITLRWQGFDAENRILLKRLTGEMGRGYLIYGIVLLTLQADTLLVGWLAGAETVATFTLIWNIASTLIQILWRISETLQPYFTQLDAQGEQEKMSALYRRASQWVFLASLGVGLFYALFGAQLVKLWVKGDAPNNPLAFWLAGGAIFWIGMARLPAIYAYACVNIKKLNQIAGVELACKIILSLLLFPKFGYVAPILAINIVHLCGIAFAYRRLFPHHKNRISSLAVEDTR